MSQRSLGCLERWIATCIVCVSAAAGYAAGAGVAVQPVRFDIDAGDAESTLRQFSAQAGVGIVFGVDNIVGVRTCAVHGLFAPVDALRLLLSGTPLMEIQDPATGAFAVRRAAQRPFPTAAPVNPVS